MTKLSTAVHEAGHAVLSRYFGMVLQCVAVSPACGLRDEDGITKAASQPSCNEDRAVIFLAGFAAEHHHNPDAVNWHEFRCALRYGKDRTELDAVMQCCLPDDLAEENQEAELDKLIMREFERTKQLIAKSAHWRAITALSERLFQEPHQLTGDEAMEIIDGELSR